MIGQGVTGNEKPKQLPASIVRKYDLDKDGLLNEDEKAVWKADVQRGRQEALARRLEKYDSNRDGKLDKAEKAAAAADTSRKPGKADGKQAPQTGRDDPAGSDIAETSAGTISAVRK